MASVGPQPRTETREGTQSIKKQLFTVEMQPRCSTHRTLSTGQREGGRPGPGQCPSPTRTQPCCCRPVHAVGGGRSLGAWEQLPALLQQLRQVVSSPHRRLQHATHVVRPRLLAPPQAAAATGQDPPRAVSGGCSRPPPSLPRPPSPCRRACWVRLDAPPDRRAACSFEHSRVAGGGRHPPKGSRGSCPGRPVPGLLTLTLGHLEGL